jgi:hypothetical protein
MADKLRKLLFALENRADKSRASRVEAAPAVGRTEGIPEPDHNRKLVADFPSRPETNIAADIDLIDYH